MYRLAWILIVLSLLTAAGRPARGAEEGLIGCWSFDEPSGLVAKDSSAGGHDAQLHGPARVEGVRGGAVHFNGQDDFAALGDLGQWEAVTIAFWMKPDDVTKADYQGLVTSDTWEEGVFHIPIASGAVDVYLHLGGSQRGRLTGPRLRRGVWYHVAVTADRKPGRLQLFLNGCEADRDDISALRSPIKLQKQVIGREFDDQKPARHFQGAIDEVRIYRRALAEAEVKALCPGAPPVARPAIVKDPRNVRTGWVIPHENYCDQPYVVVTKDGNWLCTLTTGPGKESEKGQHIIATVSSDHGRTWSQPVDIEPSTGPEASWVIPLVVPSGRVYAFYNYNGDQVHTLDGKPISGDELGWYVWKYSDDNGRTWSSQRRRLPMRLTACDRNNAFQGEVQMFWGIDKPQVVGRSVMFAFTKLGKYQEQLGEGWFYRSDNVLTENDAAKVRWELLPDGDRGVRAELFGSVQEEHNLVALGDRGQDLFCVNRTTMGHPCQAFSHDGGHTWTAPEPMNYCPGGRIIRTPRACPMLWRTAGGKFLFWFHNNATQTYTARNPVWLTGGIEREGKIHWSQPEILLYDPSLPLGMSYPDLIEQDGRYWVTETQKTIPRVHEIDKTLVEGLWNQGQDKTVSRQGLVLDLGPAELAVKEVKLSKTLDVQQSGGLSLEVWIKLDDTAPGQIILDSRDAAGAGLALLTGQGDAVRIELSDGHVKASWDCDPGLLKPGKLQHVVAVVDAGPKIITFVVDGILCDGGTARKFGWGRFSGELADVSGSGSLCLGPALRGQIQRLRVYDRYLRTSEAVAHFHAGP